MFEKLVIVSVPVKDQMVSKKFYTEVLGCKVVEEVPFPAPDTLWIRLALPGIETQLVLVKTQPAWFPRMKPGSLQGVVITTRDIVKTHEELRRRGLNISEIEDQPYAKEATFSDPDGNGWVLQQSPS